MIRPAKLSEIMPAIAAHWSPNHPTGRDETFARHWFCTPWVNRNVFTHGVSALVEMDGDRFLGMSSVMVTPTAAWHMIWFVAPEAKGTGLGRRLIAAMIEHIHPKPMHVLGIHPLGLPFYQKFNFQLRPAVRYRLDPPPYAPTTTGASPDEDWIRYRYTDHPSFKYERRGDTIVRADYNDWGRVLHVARLGRDWPEALSGDVYRYNLVQCWAYDSPGVGWTMPPAHVPTVFQPPTARGNTLWVAGLPSLPSEIHGSDGGQDRPA